MCEEKLRDELASAIYQKTRKEKCEIILKNQDSEVEVTFLNNFVLKNAFVERAKNPGLENYKLTEITPSSVWSYEEREK